MTKKYSVIIPFLTLLVIAALFITLWSLSRKKPPPVPLPPPVSVLSLAVADRHNYGQTGAVHFTNVEEGLEVALDLTGAPEEILQPASIRKGLCYREGELLYELNPLADGKSKTVLADVSLDQLLSLAPWVVVVAKSEEEPNEFIACVNRERVDPIETQPSQVKPGEKLTLDQTTPGFASSVTVSLGDWTAYVIGVDQGTKTRILLGGRQNVSGSEHTVTIYSGSCQKLGKATYKLHPILNEWSDSDTVLQNISLAEFWSNLPMAVVISKSADEPAPLACGDLKIPK